MILTDEELAELNEFYQDAKRGADGGPYLPLDIYIRRLLATIDADRARIAELEGRDEQSTQKLAAVSQTCIDLLGWIAALKKDLRSLRLRHAETIAAYKDGRSPRCYRCGLEDGHTIDCAGGNP